MNTMKPCSIDGCVKPHYGHGWCAMHHKRWARHGDPMVTLVSPTPEGPLTADRLRELLDYDPETGVFTRRRLRSNIKAGAEAGCVASRGYLLIRVDDVLHKAHRLAWLHVHGSWPNGDIDHRNNDTSDNRIANLREATHPQNSQNVSRPNKNNASGCRGVTARRGKWRAQIMVRRRTIYLGTFDTPEEAHAAYIAAKRTHHPFWSEAESA